MYLYNHIYKHTNTCISVYTYTQTDDSLASRSFEVTLNNNTLVKDLKFVLLQMH